MGTHERRMFRKAAPCLGPAPRRRAAVAVLLAIVLLATSVMPRTALALNDPLVFGVVPQQSATRLARAWIPFLNEVSARAGVQIRFATATDIPTFEGCLGESAYDLSHMNPYHFTVFNKRAGYHALAHQRETRLRGLIVIRKDAPMTELRDLNGHEVAFPSPAAFAASAIQRAELRALGIDIRPVYVRSHDSVYRAVDAGIFVAGGGIGRTFGNAPAEIRERLRVLHQTKAYTPHAFAIHERVPEAIRARIAAAITAIEPDHPVMKTLGMKGLQAASDAEWDDVRQLGLSEADTGIRLKGTAPCPSG